MSIRTAAVLGHVWSRMSLDLRESTGTSMRSSLLAPVGDQFHKERTPWLGHRVHSGIQVDRVRVPLVERIAQTEPNVEIRQQVCRAEREIGEVYGLQSIFRERQTRGLILHAGTEIEFSTQGHREAQLRQMLRRVLQDARRIA